MAVIQTASNVTSNISSALGLDGWQLADGKYNGCTFCHFVKIPLLENNPIYQIGMSAYATANQMFGFSPLGEDKNKQYNLVDTTLGVISMSDEYYPQTVVKPLPYAGKVNTEPMGGGGYEFRFTILCIGQDYQKAISNIEDAIKNPPASSDKKYKLIHPTRGELNGVTRVTSYRVLSNIAVWNGATIEIAFRSEDSNIQSIAKKRLVQQIATAIQQALGLVLAINATITEIQTAIQTGQGLLGANRQYSAQTYTVSVNTDTKIKSVSDSLYSNTNYVYKNSNSGVRVAQLDNTPINTAAIPKALSYSIGTGYNGTQGDIIMGTYAKQCEELIAYIATAGFDQFSNNLINQINESVAALYNVCNLCAQTEMSYGYSVPYTMSIHEVLALNGMNLSLAQQVLKNNPQIPSANYIPKGLVVKL